MQAVPHHLELRLARDARDLRAAQRLRYEVFVAELGGDGAGVDHDARLERDRYDDGYEHLLLIDLDRDPARLEDVVGVYRLLRSDRAAHAGGFYTATEYDLAPLLETGRRLLELGRSCVHRDYRGGPAMFLLWNALAEYVIAHEVEVLFGVASFHGTDLAALAQPLSFLHHNHLAPPDLRVRALPGHYTAMDVLAPEAVDRRAALAAIPPLIKGYLRLGGHVGDGAFIDRDFNTTDVCLVMDTMRMSARRREGYLRKAAGGHIA
jgi:L-ornithine Nalpha-acyltransferase